MSTEIQLPPSRRMEPAEPPQPPDAPDDASSRALSDALKSSFGIVRILMIGLVIVFLGSGFFTVGPQERAVILRFGKPLGEGEKALRGPGFNWALPYPVDEVVRIPITQVQTVNSTVGWYATSAAMEAAGQEPPPGESLNPAQDGYVLTADGNVLHVRGTLRYRIKEPGLQYVFNFGNTSNLVQNAFNHAIVFAAASYKVDDILTGDFAGFRERVRQRLEDLVERDQLGVVVDQVDIQARPPRQLQAQFNAVSEAEVKRGKLLNEAKTYASQTINRGKSDAAARIASAEADRTRMVAFVAAEAERFNHLLPQYRSQPNLFIRQYQTDTLNRVLTNVTKFVLPKGPDGSPSQLRIELDRERPKPKVAPPPAPEKGH